jgi:hypothetical protein
MAIVASMGLVTDRRQTDQLFNRWGPVIHLRDADASGVARGLLLRQTSAGELLRISKSAFVQAGPWNSITERERFRRRSIAFGLCISDDAHLTGPAAALLLGLPLFAEPTGVPVALRPGDPHTGHDRSPYGRVRHGHLPLVHRTIRSRVGCVSAAFCAVDISRHLGPVDGLVVADAALHGGTTREALYELIRNMQAYPGIATALWVAQHADPRSESPLETLGRHAFISAGITPPLSNVWICVLGQWFRVDHLLPDSGVVLEADGAIKYDDRPDASVIVTNEKERERLLRGAGFGVARYSYADAVGRPSAILRKATEAARLRNGLPVPTCWMLDPPWRAADETARLNWAQM